MELIAVENARRPYGPVVVGRLPVVFRYVAHYARQIHRLRVTVSPGQILLECPLELRGSRPLVPVQISSVLPAVLEKRIDKIGVAQQPAQQRVALGRKGKRVAPHTVEKHRIVQRNSAPLDNDLVLRFDEQREKQSRNINNKRDGIPGFSSPNDRGLMFFHYLFFYHVTRAIYAIARSYVTRLKARFIFLPGEAGQRALRNRGAAALRGVYLRIFARKNERIFDTLSA